MSSEVSFQRMAAAALAVGEAAGEAAARMLIRQPLHEQTRVLDNIEEAFGRDARSRLALRMMRARAADESGRK